MFREFQIWLYSMFVREWDSLIRECEHYMESSKDMANQELASRIYAHNLVLLERYEVLRSYDLEKLEYLTAPRALYAQRTSVRP